MERRLVRQTDMAGVLLAERAGKMLGCVSTFDSALADFGDVKPWISGLFVSPEHRGSGLGALLMAEAERCVASAGFEAAYLHTTNAFVYHQRRKWMLFAEFQKNGESVYVMKKNIATQSPT